jgi:nucleoside-diphosphate-sugar epimerase
MTIIKGKKILIIGANSVLVSKILTQLESCFVVGLINNNDNRVNYSNFFKIYSNFDLLIKEQKHFDIVFLIAAYIPYGNMDLPGKMLFNTNIDLIVKTVKTYEEARIVFTSSVSVYGTPQNDVINIDSAFNKPNLYGLSKLAGETIIKMQRSFGIVRLTSLYGIGVTSDTFINRIIKQAKTDRIIKIFGSGKRLQNYIHIEDAAEILIKVASLQENLVILGVSKESHSNLDIAQIISEKTNAKVVCEGIDLSNNYLYDAEECYKKISFHPQKEFKQGLIEMI